MTRRKEKPYLSTPAQSLHHDLPCRQLPRIGRLGRIASGGIGGSRADERPLRSGGAARPGRRRPQELPREHDSDGEPGDGPEGSGALVVEEEADEVGEAAVEGAGDAAHQRDGVLVGGEARHCAGWGWGAVRLGLTCFCRVVGRGGGGGRRGGG
jgi:hypothetical protein